MSSVHIPGYLNCPECEITAIADINSAALEKTSARLGRTPVQCFSSHKERLVSGLVDTYATPFSRTDSRQLDRGEWAKKFKMF